MAPGEGIPADFQLRPAPMRGGPGASVAIFCGRRVAITGERRAWGSPWSVNCSAVGPTSPSSPGGPDASCA